MFGAGIAAFAGSPARLVRADFAGNAVLPRNDTRPVCMICWKARGSAGNVPPPMGFLRFGRAGCREGRTVVIQSGGGAHPGGMKWDPIPARSARIPRHSDTERRASPFGGPWNTPARVPACLFELPPGWLEQGGTESGDSKRVFVIRIPFLLLPGRRPHPPRANST